MVLQHSKNWWDYFKSNSTDYQRIVCKVVQRTINSQTSTGHPSRLDMYYFYLIPCSTSGTSMKDQHVEWQPKSKPPIQTLNNNLTTISEPEFYCPKCTTWRHKDYGNNSPSVITWYQPKWLLVCADWTTTLGLGRVK